MVRFALSVRPVAIVSAALSLISSTASADDTQKTLEELRAQNAALMARIEKLEQQQKAREDKLDAAAADAVTQAVLRDAIQRSQFLASEGFTAGYDKGKFLIQSADGNFVLNPNAMFQFRYAANCAEGDGDFEDGFTVRRLKLSLDGNLWSKDFRYTFMWGNSRSNGSLVLEDAFVEYTLPQWRDFTIKAGQYKDPTFHEEIVSAKRMLAAERSLVNEALGGGLTDRVQGVGVIYAPKDAAYRIEAGYNDGINTDNTDWFDAGGTLSIGAGAPHWGAYARGEYKVMGDWASYRDFTTLNNKNDLLVIGAGASYTDAGGYAFLHSFDAQYETGRIGAYVAYYGVAHENGGSDYDWGALAQLAYLIDEKLEVFGRAGWIDIQAQDAFCELTAGVNYYFHEHASKVTADVTWLPDGSPNGDTGVGVIASEDSQVILRIQYQLML